MSAGNGVAAIDFPRRELPTLPELSDNPTCDEQKRAYANLVFEVMAMARRWEERLARLESAVTIISLKHQG